METSLLPPQSVQTAPSVAVNSLRPFKGPNLYSPSLSCNGGYIPNTALWQVPCWIFCPPILLSSLFLDCASCLPFPIQFTSISTLICFSPSPISFNYLPSSSTSSFVSSSFIFPVLCSSLCSFGLLVRGIFTMRSAELRLFPLLLFLFPY